MLNIRNKVCKLVAEVIKKKKKHTQQHPVSSGSVAGNKLALFAHAVKNREGSVCLTDEKWSSYLLVYILYRAP